VAANSPESLPLAFGFVSTTNILTNHDIASFDESVEIARLAIWRPLHKHRIRTAAIRPMHIRPQNSPIPHWYWGVALDYYFQVFRFRTGAQTPYCQITSRQQAL
jgi:hypothetical protein